MFSANEFKLVRMTEEDRQTTIRMISVKRALFEAAIKRGVIAMLNAQSEYTKLQAQRQNYLSALTNRNQLKKQQITDAANRKLIII